MVEKRLLCPNRRRRTPAQFSWLDHRLVRERRLESCPVEAWALYLFLVTVGDAQGLSYYSDTSLTARVPLERHELRHARSALIGAGVVSRFVSWNPQGSSPVCSVDGLPGMTEQSGKRLESVPSPFS